MPELSWRKTIGWSTLGLALLILSASPAVALCAVCYATVAGADNQVIQSLKIGILVMLIPTLTVLTGMILFLYRLRNAEAREEEQTQMDREPPEGQLLRSTYRSGMVPGRA